MIHGATTDRSAALTAAIITSCLLIAGILFLPAVWDDTDDFRMSAIAAGLGAANGPSEFLVYVNVLIGVTLKQLYQLSPEIAWYGWFLVGCHTASQFALAFTLLRSRIPRDMLPAAFGAQLALTSYLWTHLQFTTTAALLAVAGGSLLISGLREDRKRRSTLLAASCGYVLLASALRLQSAQLVGLFVLPAAVIEAIRHRIHIRPGRDLAVLSTAAALFLALQSWNEAAYASAQHSEFKAELQHIGRVNNNIYIRNVATGLLNDPREIKAASNALSECQISPNDLTCLIWWFYPDETVFSASRLRRVDHSLSRIAPARFVRAMGLAIPRILFGSNLFLLLAGISLGVVIRLRPDTGTVLLIGGLWSLALAVMLFLLATMKLPPRVYISVATVCCTLTSILSLVNGTRLHPPISDSSLPQENGADRPRNATVWLMVMALCSCIVTFQHAVEARQLLPQRAQVEDTLKVLLQRQDKLQIGLVPFPFAWLDPLKQHNSLKDWRFVYLDGHQRSPRFNATAEHTVGMSVSRAIVQDPDVRIIVGQDAVLDYIAEFYQEHEGLSLKFPVDQRLPWGTVRRVVVNPSSEGLSDLQTGSDTQLKAPGQ